MSSFVVKNNAESLVVDNPLGAGVTTLNVTASEGANFPSTFPFLITLWDETAYPDPTDDSGMEICHCTARTTDALTIVRAQEGTGDVAHALGERVAMLITAGILNDATYGVATKLDGIESAATADQTGAEIKTAYQAEANAYTDTKNTKLAGIDTGADVTADNPPQAHNQSAATITSDILAVARGGTGVGDDTYDADKVDGCDAGVATTNVFKIPGSLVRGDIFFVDASGNLVRLPAGTNGHFLKTQSTAGDPVWADVGSAAGLFEEVTNVIREKSAGGYDNDFVIGSPQLADDGNTAHDYRMWFDKSKAAFRAGYVSGTEWDDANVGSFSHAEGWNNIANGMGAHAEGKGNTASESYAHVEGLSNLSSGTSSHAEGWGSEATGAQAHAEGEDAYAYAKDSHAEGERSKAYLYCQHAKGSGQFATNGDAQYSNVVARRETTLASATELTLTGAAPDSESRIIIPANRTWAFSILIGARQTAGSAGTVGDSAGYEIKGVIKRDGANNTALVGTITNTTIAEDQAAWAVTAVADDTNEALVVKVTGETNKTIHWVAAVHLTEVG